MPTSPTPATAFAATLTPEARAARNVPANPHPICRDFVVQPEPSAFWCGFCHWNRPLHDDETYRTAVAAELARIGDAR